MLFKNNKTSSLEYEGRPSMRKIQDLVTDEHRKVLYNSYENARD